MRHFWTKFFALAAVFMVVMATATPSHATLMSMPMHGNWCGPGTPGNGVEATYPPIDPLDQACYQHDTCYNLQGNGDCGCDIQFMNHLKSIRYPSKYLEDKARAMYDAIGLIPCTNPMGSAYKQRCVWGDLAWDAMSGRRAPWEMPLRFGRLGLDVMENKFRRGDWWNGR